MASLPIDAIVAAARRPAVVRTMRAFHVRADRLIAEQPATCWNRGLCCKFGAYGHRLYVTSLEVAYFLAVQQPHRTPTTDACPHALDGQCRARVARPLGCRVYYCDPEAAGWQGPVTEALLTTLRRLHHRLDVPYAYADWMVFLGEIAQHVPCAPGAPVDPFRILPRDNSQADAPVPPDPSDQIP